VVIEGCCMEQLVGQGQRCATCSMALCLLDRQSDTTRQSVAGKLKFDAAALAHVDCCVCMPMMSGGGQEMLGK